MIPVNQSSLTPLIPFHKRPYPCVACVKPIKGLINETSSRESGWSSRDRATLTLAADASFNSAVIVVTAFEGVYRAGDTYNGEYGYYSLEY